MSFLDHLNVCAHSQSPLALQQPLQELMTNITGREKCHRSLWVSLVKRVEGECLTTVTTAHLEFPKAGGK
jgi:hypothetical protein